MEVFWDNGNIFLNNILIGKFSRKYAYELWIQALKNVQIRIELETIQEKLSDRLYFRKFRDLRYINE